MLDTIQIKKVIKLSKLKINDSQITKFHSQINDILNFVELLKEVDVSNTNFLSLPMVNRMREDIVVDSLQSNEALSNCNNVLKGGFGVPSVLGKST